MQSFVLHGINYVYWNAIMCFAKIQGCDIWEVPDEHIHFLCYFAIYFRRFLEPALVFDRVFIDLRISIVSAIPLK